MLSRTATVIGLAALILAVWSPPGPQVAAGASTLWTVDRYGEGAQDGDLSTHRGSIRFALENAQAGDIVRIGDTGTDSLFVTQPLLVRPGVSVGYTRDEPCPDPRRPLINILALPALVNAPTVTLGAGATWRGIAIANASAYGGPKVALRIEGDDVDVCGDAFGVGYDGDGQSLEVVAPTLAMGIVGANARVHQSRIGGQVVLDVAADGAIIGDAVGGSGEANAPLGGYFVSLLASDADAARRVTVRDAVQRYLSGRLGAGVSGGDDVANHANAWAMTPSIISAVSADNYASVAVQGTASPLSLVDIYTIYAGIMVRQGEARADAAGMFAYGGPLPGGPASVLAASTLDDPSAPGRAGSSSALSGAYTVQRVAAGEPLLAAVGSVTNLSRPGSATALPGEQIRLSVTMTGVGTAALTGLSATGMQLNKAVQVIPGTGAVSGGAGFTATDAGFSGGRLGPGQRAVYSLDATVTATSLTTVVFALEVSGDAIAAAPVVGRMGLVSSAGQAPVMIPQIWLPIVEAP